MISPRMPFSAAFISAAMLAGHADALNIDASSTLVPAGLGNGDSFQLVFVTSTKVAPDGLDGSVDGVDSTTAADWNAHANAVADASALQGIADINWFAIVSLQDLSDGSTDPGVQAKDNAIVGEDVYRTDGALVQTAANFYTSNHLVPIKWNENGEEQDTAGGSGSGRLVWTGMNTDGTISNRPLGNPSPANGGVRTGNAESVGDDWGNTGDHLRRGVTTVLRVYALSEVLTVGSAVPGDTDGDGDIDDTDLGTSFANYTGPVGAAGNKTTADGDTDADGDVDDTDLGTSFAGYTGPLGPASVPEPGGLAVIGLAALMLGRRRRV